MHLAKKVTFTDVGGEVPRWSRREMLTTSRCIRSSHMFGLYILVDKVPKKGTNYSAPRHAAAVYIPHAV